MTNRLAQTTARIEPPDRSAEACVRARLATRTKPDGALGRLEGLAIDLAGMQARALPSVARRAVLTFAADHGVARRGTSRYPSDVTGQMVRNFLSGGAAINVFARQTATRLVVADVGVASAYDVPDPIATGVRYVRAPFGAGTADLVRAPAMSPALALQAISLGITLVEQLRRDPGLDAIAIGEMGIGNTTAASCLVGAITGADVAAVTGRGTGIDDPTLIRKREVVTQALVRHRLRAEGSGLDTLASLGGFEIAAMVGAIIGAASRRVPVVLDGFIAGAASLVAVAIAPACRAYLIAGHRSAEPGHAVTLRHLSLDPILDLALRLGEGTGAVLAFPILDAACLALAEMASFAGAGVATADPPT